MGTSTSKKNDRTADSANRKQPKVIVFATIVILLVVALIGFSIFSLVQQQSAYDSVASASSTQVQKS